MAKSLLLLKLLKLMMKLLVSMVIMISMFSSLAVEHYLRKLYDQLDSLLAVRKLKYLTWVVIALDAIVVMGLTYKTGFSPFKSKVEFFVFIAADIFFIWYLFRWVKFLPAFKAPQILICRYYLKLHEKYMAAKQYDQADAAAKKALECDSQSYWIWLKLANNFIFTEPNSERISQYLENAQEIIEKNGNKNEEVADYKISLVYLFAKKGELAIAIEHLKQSLNLHYTRSKKKFLKRLEKYRNSQSK